MTNLITIQQAVDSFKELIECSIIDGGIKAKEAMIRSSRPINFIHEAVKSDLIRKGVSADRIHPPLGSSKPELKLAGFIKQKYQDVCVSPKGYIPESEIISAGILREATDYYGKAYTERTISINIRSQMSSLAKNFDTLYERVCLLLVDFEQSPAKIYGSNQDLINDGLLDENSSARIDELSWETFTDNILANYETRFGN